MLDLLLTGIFPDARRRYQDEVDWLALHQAE